MRLRVTYHRAADLVADHDEQLAKGGLLVRVEPPAGLELFADVEVEIVPDFASLADGIVIPGQVIHLLPGVGVAVGFDAAPLADAVAAARAAAPRTGRPPTHELAPAGARPPQPPPSKGAETAAKIQQALHGNRDDRARILRDLNKTLHPYVLRNPGLGLDEVLALVKMTTVAPELLKQICERKEWAQRPDIAIALVRNPKLATPLALRLLDFVSPSDLRHLAKDNRAKPAIAQAARKKVIG